MAAQYLHDFSSFKSFSISNPQANVKIHSEIKKVLSKQNRIDHLPNRFNSQLLP